MSGDLEDSAHRASSLPLFKHCPLLDTFDQDLRADVLDWFFELTLGRDPVLHMGINGALRPGGDQQGQAIDLTCSRHRQQSRRHDSVDFRTGYFDHLCPFFVFAFNESQKLGRRVATGNRSLGQHFFLDGR